jgi:hypothetical protein
MWGKNSWLPGLFSNQAAEGEWWVDGTGSFSGIGATPYSSLDLRRQANGLFPFDGIQLRTMRKAADDGSLAKELKGNAMLYSPLYFYHEGDDVQTTNPYGFPTSVDLGGNPIPLEPDKKFKYFTKEELGGPEAEQIKSRFESTSYGGDGYVAYLMPFFSPVYLPAEEGLAADVTPMRKVMPGTTEEALYYCVRTSTNGVWIKQLCEASLDTNEGLVRQAAMDWWRTLMQMHWIDHQTEFVSLTMQMKSVNAKFDLFVRFTFEFQGVTDAVPSFSVVPRPAMASGEHEEIKTLTVICYFFVVLFVTLELVQLWADDDGLVGYFSDGWNCVDWVNYIIFTLAMIELRKGLIEPDLHESLISQTVGYTNLASQYDHYWNARWLMAFFACLQLLSIIKFVNHLLPKCGAISDVLSNAATDMSFFCITFGISLIAFAELFYLVCGYNLAGYSTLNRALMSMIRGLFGDFDFDELEKSSNGNGSPEPILLLLYVFVAVFIVLNMFLTLLGNSAGKVLLNQEKQERMDRRMIAKLRFPFNYWVACFGYPEVTEDDSDDDDDGHGDDGSREHVKCELLNFLDVMKTQELEHSDEKLHFNALEKLLGETERKLKKMIQGQSAKTPTKPPMPTIPELYSPGTPTPAPPTPVNPFASTPLLAKPDNTQSAFSPGYIDDAQTPPSITDFLSTMASQVDGAHADADGVLVYDTLIVNQADI